MMPTSSSAPGRVTTKLCGIRSLFSKTTSTGLPASTTIRSLSKSIWSGTVPIRITPDAQVAQLAADGLGLVAGQERGEGVGELQGVERGGRGAVGGGDGADVGDQAVEQRPGLLGGPVGGGDALEGADGGRAVLARLDEPGQRLEGRPFLAADGRQRGHRRAADQALGAAAADLDDGLGVRGRLPFALEDRVAGAVEDLEREPVEPRLEALARL